MSTIAAATPGRLTSPLLLTHWRELSRSRANFYFVLAFPFLMSGMFLAMNSLLASSMSGSGPDFTSLVVPLALCLALTGTCMTLTSGPIAEYRDQGTLRVLGTTPVSRSQFIMTHLAIRVVLAITLAALVILFGAVVDAVSVTAVWKAVIVAVPSSVLFLGLGYIIGSLVGSGQAATNIATFVQLFTMFTGGVAFPQSLLSDSVLRILDLLPTTYFGDLLYWVAGSDVQRHSTVIDFTVVAVAAAIVVPLAVGFFRWESTRN